MSNVESAQIQPSPLVTLLQTGIETLLNPEINSRLLHEIYSCYWETGNDVVDGLQLTKDFLQEHREQLVPQLSDDEIDEQGTNYIVHVEYQDVVIEDPPENFHQFASMEIMAMVASFNSEDFDDIGHNIDFAISENGKVYFFKYSRVYELLETAGEYAEKMLFDTQKEDHKLPDAIVGELNELIETIPWIKGVKALTLIQDAGEKSFIFITPNISPGDIEDLKDKAILCAALSESIKDIIDFPIFVNMATEKEYESSSKVIKLAGQ